MFDLKYRPQKLNDVIGNKSLVLVLKSRIKTKSLFSRSLLLSGPKGCGKTTTARIIAKTLYCDNPSQEGPCLECYGCNVIESGADSSFFEFDAATSGTVENIRNIVDGIEYGSVDGKPTIVIMDEAHRLSKGSQDALLKTLEDRRIFIIFCTTEPYSMRSAMRDRLEEYTFSPPSREDLVSRLAFVCDQEKIEYTLPLLNVIAEKNSDNPRTSLTSLYSIHMMGGLDELNISNYFGDDLKECVHAMLLLWTNGSVDFWKRWDFIVRAFSPAETKEAVCSVISEFFRHMTGVKKDDRFTKFRFTESIRLMARDISYIERPQYADIEMLLFTYFDFTAPVEYTVRQAVERSDPTREKPVEAVREKLPEATEWFEKGTSSIPSVVASQKKKQEISIDKPQVKRTVEVDGVVFTTGEDLTSLDAKMRKTEDSPSPSSSNLNARTFVPEYSSDNILSEGDWANGVGR